MNLTITVEAKSIPRHDKAGETPNQQELLDTLLNPVDGNRHLVRNGRRDYWVEFTVVPTPVEPVEPTSSVNASSASEEPATPVPEVFETKTETPVEAKPEAPSVAMGNSGKIILEPKTGPVVMKLNKD